MTRVRPLSTAVTIAVLLFLAPHVFAQCTIGPSSVPDGLVDVAYKATQLSVSGGAGAPYTWAESRTNPLPPGLSLTVDPRNSAAASVSGTPKDPGKYTSVIEVTDSKGIPCSATYAIIIGCRPIDVTPATLPAGVVGAPYATTTFSASGATGPYTFTRTGTVPPGLIFDPGRATLSGTPTAAGSFTFTIRATEPSTCAGAQTYTVNVVCPTIAVGGSVPAAGKVGVAYTARFTASGGTPGYSYSITGNVPPGLTFSAAGDLSGTPATAGTFTFDVTARDANGCPGVNRFTVTICPNIAIDPVSAPDGTVGVLYKASFSSAGGTLPVSLAIDSVPPGLTFVDGDLTGIPTRAGAFDFTITATDANRCTGSRLYRITICPAITIMGVAPAGTVGVGYKTSFSANGGTTPYSYSISGSIPPGLTFAGGDLTGTPTTAGTYTFTVLAVDAGKCSGSGTFTLVISEPACPAISITPASVPTATVGTGYKIAFSASGGSGPYSYLVAGDVPPGLTFSAGEVLGTPTTPGTFTFTITATDVKACSGSARYSLVVASPACPAITVNPSALPNATVGTDYKVAFSASGGTTPHSYSITGTVPPGLSFTAGDLGGTPTTAGTFTFTVVAADANRCTGSRTYSLVVADKAPTCPSITVQPATLGNGEVRTPYSASFSTVGAIAPVSFSLAAGTLPPGLALSGNVLSGTPTAAGTYRFTVKATDANRCAGATDYSLTIADVTICPTASPSLIAPAAGATFDGADPIKFAWSAVSGANAYDVLVSADGGANYTTVASTTGESSTSATAGLPAGSFTWFVRARFGLLCKATESAASKFSIVAKAACPTAVAQLIAPANGATGVANPVAFSWAAVNGASGYRLLMSVNGGAATAAGSTTGTSLSLDVPAGATIDWTVETLFDRCPPTVGRPFRFTTKPIALACPSAAPALVSPSNGASNLTSPVTLQWTAVAGVSSYLVHASIDGGTAAVIGRTTATQLSATLPAGRVEWQVEAVFDGCPSTFSPRAVFSVSGGLLCSSNTAPTLNSPPNGATDVQSPVAFTWSDVPRAVAYKLFLSLNGSTFEQAGITTTTSLTQILPAGTISWYVDAVFIGCEPTRSSTSRFTVTEPKRCPTGTIDLIAPASGAALTSPAGFSWTPIAGAAGYRLWAAVDGGTPAIIAKTANTSISTGVPSGSIEWYVEAVFADCPSIFSRHSTFTVAKANACDTNPAPVPVAPTGEVTVPLVDFRWNASAGAIAYRLWLSTAGQAFEDIGLTRETHLERELKPNAYVWYVEAIFDGCPAVVSAKESFRIADTAPRCPTDAPSLVSPADGATNVSSPVTLLWSSVPDAIGYRVFASIGADFVPIGATADTSLTIPAPPTTVTWFVEAVFKACPSTRSGRARFTVQQSANCSTEKPQLVAPRDGANDITSPVTFTWSPVSGGLRYVIVAKPENGSPAPIGETAATSFTRPVPPGTTEWWVIAFRAGCDPIESAHSTFTIPVQQACDARPPVLLTPADGATTLISPVRLAWTAVRGARAYKVWVVAPSGVSSLVATTTATEISAPIPPSTLKWYVEAIFDNCPPLESAVNTFSVIPAPAVCRAPERPGINAVGQALSGTQYTVRWTSVAASAYELQESSNRDFAGASTTVVNGTFASFTYSAAGSPMVKFYRVRGISSCSDDRGPYSDVVPVIIVPVNTIETKTRGTAEIGVQGALVQTLFIPGSDPPVTFTARTDRPWLHVSPESGILGPAGVTLTLTADPGALFVGANTGTVLLTYGGAGAGKQTGHGAAPASVPVSISLVTPVGPGGKNTPPPDSLIIPAVAHAPGVNNSQFQSDVRVANTSSQTMKYQLNFTPSGTDGTLTGSSTTIQIEPGATTALDDILASFFGSGTSGSSSGMLEIRPLTATSTSTGLSSSRVSVASPTIASSRTYNVTSTGTLGQYIPAVPFANFIGKTAGGQSVLSLQQIAQSQAYRTNLGLVEGSGEPATVMIRVFDAANQLVAEIPESLRASEHKQLNSILSAQGITLDDGRFEVEVTSDTGRVSAYASRIDNVSNDPLLVSPVLKESARGTRYVLPGIAYSDGLARWRSDVRIYNNATTATEATLTYHPQGNPSAAMTKAVSLAPGQVLALDNVLNQFFGITEPNAGGSLLVSTNQTSSLIATARTYAQSDAGTYGLFLDAVRPDQAIGLGERSLHLLQLEQSAQFRTNIGLFETTGNDATAEVTLILPDSKVTPKVSMPLSGNSFVQFPISAFNVGDAVYNARISIKVTSGSGRVSAYGSVVDNYTQDPTYVPAQ